MISYYHKSALGAHDSFTTLLGFQMKHFATKTCINKTQKKNVCHFQTLLSVFTHVHERHIHENVISENQQNAKSLLQKREHTEKVLCILKLCLNSHVCPLHMYEAKMYHL